MAADAFQGTGHPEKTCAGPAGRRCRVMQPCEPGVIAQQRRSQQSETALQEEEVWATEFIVWSLLQTLAVLPCEATSCQTRAVQATSFSFLYKDPRLVRAFSAVVFV